MSVLRKNIDEKPYTGKRIVRGKLKLSEKEWLNMFFDGTPNTDQVTGVTRGKIYDVILVEGFGDLEDVTFINDNKDIQTLGSYFFEEIDDEFTMTDKQAAVIIYKQLRQFVNHSDWLNINTQEQARALFTTLCIMGDVEADTSVCDNILLELYNDLGMQNIDVQYNDFEDFMVGLMV